MTTLPGASVVRDNPERSRYEVLVDGAVAGFAEYRLRPATIIFTHTQVDPAYEGRGLGSQLVRYGLDDARARKLRVRPICPFFASYIAEHPAYADLVRPPT
jgi:predicted GNAT family acetyltransferase